MTQACPSLEPHQPKTKEAGKSVTDLSKDRRSDTQYKEKCLKQRTLQPGNVKSKK